MLEKKKKSVDESKGQEKAEDSDSYMWNPSMRTTAEPFERAGSMTPGSEQNRKNAAFEYGRKPGLLLVI